MSEPAARARRAPNSARRDPAAHQAILDATVAILEEGGYGRLTIEAVAARAGVGKQTIYRWWPGKATLVLEAYTAVSAVRSPLPDTGDLGDDLLALLLPIFALNAVYDRGTALANKGMMAEAQVDPAFRETYGRLHAAWRGPLRDILARGQARGELRAATDLDALVDTILGAAWYRLLLEHAPLDERFAREIVATVTGG